MEMKSVTLFVLVIGILSATDADSRTERDDGDIITITTIEETPYVIIKDNTIHGLEKYTGFIPDLLKYIADDLKLNYEIKLVDDGRYGSKSEDGKWNGMIGEIHNMRADVAAAPVTISSEREAVVNFTKPFMNFFTTVLMKKPKPGQELPITNVEDLANQDEISYGILDDGMTETFFRGTNDKNLKKMWDKMKSSPGSLMKTTEDGMQKVRSSDGKYAFIMESTTADYWINQKPCDLTKTGKLNIRGNGFAVGKKVGLLEKLNGAILKLREDGTLNELTLKWWKGDCKVDPIGASSAIPIRVSSVMTIVLSLVWSLRLSL